MNRTQERIVTHLLRGEGSWLSRAQVGQGVGLKKTPYLSHLLDDLVERGVIERMLGSYGGFSCWFYLATAVQVQQFLSIPVLDWMNAVESEHHAD